MSAADNVSTILASGVRLSVPLAFAACGEYLAQRAGALNISVEGMMLGATFGSVAVASATGSAATGLLAGVLIGLVIGLVHANLAHRVEINTFVVGLVLNALVLGVTSYLITLSTFESHQVAQLSIPLLRDIPIIGPPVFVERWPAYLLLAIIPGTWWLVERSRWGLELRAVGENPQAADVTGIRVNTRRRQALLWCGALAGWAGHTWQTPLANSIAENLTSYY
jgi:general nucleoside transport system permease protein